MALAPFAPHVLYEGAETGGLVEGGLRRLCKMFDEGLVCTELNVKPLGGALFGAAAMPVLSRLHWGEKYRPRDEGRERTERGHLARRGKCGRDARAPDQRLAASRVPTALRWRPNSSWLWKDPSSSTTAALPLRNRTGA